MIRPEFMLFVITTPNRLSRSERHGGREMLYYRALLADVHVDAVGVLTPHPLHEEIAIEAAKAGKHVALQKPITTDLKSAFIQSAFLRAGGTDH
ncbi:MAG: Gfo/Idh/MocA family oxidoreductase [Desulfobacterales bacterium]